MAVAATTSGEYDSHDPYRPAETEPPPQGPAEIRWPRLLLAALLVGVLALALRLPGLGHPDEIVFDETYYAKDAWAMLTTGVAREWDDDADERIVEGDLSGIQEESSFVSHPPGGKWVIAAGEQVLGMTPTGWRIAGTVAGSIAAAAMVLAGALAVGKTRWGVFTGTLVAVDGMAVAISRTALLDGILMAWVVLATVALLADRRWYLPGARVRLWRPWRLLAGIALGMATATKWNGLPVLAAFGLLTVGWQYRGLREAGIPPGTAVRRTLLLDAPVGFVTVVGSAVVAYLATWTAWLRSDDGYGRSWATDNPTAGVADLVPEGLRALWHYHVTIYELVATIDATHPWSSHPGGWLVQQRPVLFYSEQLGRGEAGCPADSCVSQVMALGTPVIWWAGTAAVLVCGALWLLARDWGAGLAVVGVMATWIPWFAAPDRPLFAMYVVVTLPFVALGLAVVASRLASSRRLPRLSRALVVVFVVVVAWQTWFFYPLWTAEVLTLEEWRTRMWLPGWS